MGSIANYHAVRPHIHCNFIVVSNLSCSLRKLAPQSHPSAQSLLLQNPYTPTSELANAIMKTSRFLEELVAVREWLHETAPYPPSDPGSVTGYWKFTKYEVLQSKRMGKGKERETAGDYVLDMDPDAPNRGEGRSLAADDAVCIADLLLQFCGLTTIDILGLRQGISPGTVYACTSGETR